MATYKVVNITQLETDLTAIAAAIRSKTGGTAKLSFPTGMINAINSLTGAVVTKTLEGMWEIDAAKLYSKCVAQSQTINFQAGTYAGGRPCTGIVCTNSGLYYVYEGSNVQVFSKNNYQYNSQYWLHANIDEDESEVNVIDFGTTPQSVSETFYNWFMSVAIEYSRS